MTRRPVLPAALAVALLVVGQLVAFAHEAGTRHITCTQHGEQLEAAILVGARHLCPNQHWVGVEGNGGRHADCAISRALHQSTTRASTLLLTGIAHAVIHVDAPGVALQHPTTALFRIAPKTSPPSTPITVS
jgi:hypothetical protein